MFFELCKEFIIRRGINSISPIILKILSEKNINALIIKALNLRADIKEMIETQAHNFAKSLDLVTADELMNLKMAIKDLESQIEKLRSELIKKAPKKSKSQKQTTQTL